MISELVLNGIMRLGGFVLLNVLAGWGIYALFKRAGVLGQPKAEDAELIEA